VHPILATSETAIFDLDGTLVHSRIDFPRLRAAAVRLAEEAGFPSSTLEHPDAMSIVYDVCARMPDAESELFRMSAFDEFEAIESEYCLDCEARDGAREVLAVLKRMGVATGVATRNSRRLASSMLREAGLEVGCVITREEVGRVKPDPEHYWTVVAVLGQERRNICVIGDHPSDVLGGRNIKAATVAVLPPGRDRSYYVAQPPDVIVSELSELLG
jgi:phosphoglycolate phosphatase